METLSHEGAGTADPDGGRASIARRVRPLMAAARRRANQMARVAGTPHEVVRTLSSRGMGRAFPLYRTQVAVLAAIEVLVFLVVGVVKPILLIPLLALVAVAIVWYQWQARATRGRKHGWPPGPIGVGSRALSEPGYLLALWRKHGNVFKTNHFRQRMACVVGMRTAAELLNDHEESLAPLPLPWNAFIPKGMTRWMEGEVHDEYRALLKTSFGAKLLSENEPRITEELDRAFERMSGHDAVHPWNDMEEAVRAAWLDVFFGIPRGTTEFDTLMAGYSVIAVDKPQPLPAVHAALFDMERLIRSTAHGIEGVTDRKRTVLDGIMQRQEGAAENPTTILNLIYLVETSTRDVAGLLTWLFKHLGDQPAYLREVGDSDEDHHGPRSLTSRIVSETLRLEQSEHLFRWTAKDIAFKGFVIPAGWVVRVCVHESHRDPAIFKDPESHDADRFHGSRFAGDYEPFGVDRHACVGESLARLVARLLVTRLAAGYELAVVADGPRELSGQRHWAPSSRFQVRLTRLS